MGGKPKSRPQTSARARRCHVRTALNKSSYCWRCKGSGFFLRRLGKFFLFHPIAEILDHGSFQFRSGEAGATAGFFERDFVSTEHFRFLGSVAEPQIVFCGVKFGEYSGLATEHGLPNPC